MTSKEVNALLAQSDQMLAENHFAAPQLREEVWNLRELLEDFTARTKEREKTLHEAADFFRNTEKVRVCVCSCTCVCLHVCACALKKSFTLAHDVRVYVHYMYICLSTHTYMYMYMYTSLSGHVWEFHHTSNKSTPPKLKSCIII